MLLNGEHSASCWQNENSEHARTVNPNGRDIYILWNFLSMGIAGSPSCSGKSLPAAALLAPGTET